jgi:hypothetical protein
VRGLRLYSPELYPGLESTVALPTYDLSIWRASQSNDRYSLMIAVSTMLVHLDQHAPLGCLYGVPLGLHAAS